MMYVVGTLRVLAWAWAILLVLGICVVEVYLQGFSAGMRAASMMILSPIGLYIFTPSFFLAIGAVILGKLSTDEV